MVQAAAPPRPSLVLRLCSYCRRQSLELPANIFEAIALVLVVFVQDVAFKESIVICAVLLTASFVLHGLAFRARQCQVFPKVVELTAPIPFYALLVPAYLAPGPTQKAMFIVLNFWFVVVEAAFYVALKRNFIEDYYNDWNPREVWATPLLVHAARVTAVTWVVCQVIMGLAQVFVVAFELTLERSVPGAVLMCYVMQLLPLLVAIGVTFAYPAWLRRRWGFVPGNRATCYPPEARRQLREGAVAAAGAADAAGAAGAAASAASWQGKDASKVGGGAGAGDSASAVGSACSLASADACIRICSSGSSSELDGKAAAEVVGVAQQ